MTPPEPTVRKCYNCGPGAPTDHEEKWLCARCATLFYFDDAGTMKAWIDLKPRGRGPMTPAELLRAAVRRDNDRERSRSFWEKKRALGRCAGRQCRNEPAVNPRTGAPYWLCRECRIRRCR